MYTYFFCIYQQLQVFQNLVFSKWGCFIRCYIKKKGETYEREIGDVGIAHGYIGWLVHYAGVDHHDVGELSREPQLNLHATLKLQTQAFGKF